MPGEARDQVWPPPTFHFAVALGDDLTASFQELDGLESERRATEYRHGDTPSSFYPLKMPGPERDGNVTLRRGIFLNDRKFWDWYASIKMNTVRRGTVVITLLNQDRAPSTTWTLNNAWPTRITGTDLKPAGNEVAVEALEIAYETLVVAAP